LTITTAVKRKWINVFGFEDQEAICEIGQCNHSCINPLSWHGGVEAIARGKTRRGRKKVLCRCTHFAILVGKGGIPIKNIAITEQRLKVSNNKQSSLGEWN
jgi:hypothetical protein